MPSYTNNAGYQFTYLQPNDCIGDSLGYLNSNLQNTLTLVNVASANVTNTLTTLINNVSALLVTAPSVAKAWVNFTGISSGTTCTINNQFNVSSVTRTSKGNYAITFTKPLNNAYYVVAGSAAGNSNISYAGGVGTANKSTTGFIVVVPVAGATGTVYDPVNGAEVVIFGN